MRSAMKTSDDITMFLRRWQSGDEHAGSAFAEAVYAELKVISRSFLRRERETPLQATELVNEAFLRLVEQKGIHWNDRVHFYGVAARLMRQVLIEAERRRKAQKRGGGETELLLNEEMSVDGRPSLDIIELNEALEALEEFDSRKCRLVELRYFTGLTIAESAEVLDISPATVKREWLVTKAWLHRHITGKQ